MAAVGYVHEPLANPSEQIRLLTILPARDNSSPIQTQLSSHSIPPSNASRLARVRGHLSLPSYLAISYVCGTGPETEQTHRIFIEGKEFPVAENVHAALHNYRDYTTAPVHMWIDCVCISQTDDKERSAQIILMRDIYFLAVGVYVWLGPATPESDRAIRFINNLTNSSLMNKAVDSVLELHDLEAKEKLQGSQPSMMESMRRTGMRQGYAALFKVSMPFAGASLGLADVFTNSSKSDHQASPQPLAMYPDDYQPGQRLTFQDSYNKGIQDAERKRAIMNGRESDFDESAGFWKRIGQATADERRISLKAEARLKGRKDVDFNAMGAAAKFMARRNEINKIKAEQLEMYEARMRIADQTSAQGSSLRRSETTRPEPEKGNMWKPSSNALALVQGEDFAEMARLIEKTLGQQTQYFNRMWTLQEACVGASASANRGHSQVLFKDLLKVIRYLNETLALEATDMSQVNKIQWINSEWRRSRRLPLRILLYESRDRQCLDPRDRLYALIGLMRESPNILLQPSYEKPVPEVYANATRFLIGSDRGLDVICGHGVGSQERFSGLPSWTPDFRFFGHVSQTTPLVDVSGRSNIFDASKELSIQGPDAPVTLPELWNVLTVEGIQIGTICHVSERDRSDGNSNSDWSLEATEEMWNSTAKAAKPNEQAVSALDLSNQLMSIYDKFNGVADAAHHRQMCQSLASVTAQFHNLDDESHTAVLEYLLVLICGRITPRNPCTADELELLMSQACLHDNAGIGETARRTLYAAFSAGMRGRRLAAVRTQGVGRGEADLVLTAVPEGARIGDIVCVLGRCSVPVCIRPTERACAAAGDEDKFELVGECYVSGLMDGEAWSQNRQDSTQVRDFALV